MNYGLNIKKEGALDFLSLGALVNRLDPGIIPFRKATQRMKWNDQANWDGGKELKEDARGFGKAMCFFTRQDGALVAVAKKRWVTISRDGGKTWDQPVRPDSLRSEEHTSELQSL